MKKRGGGREADDSLTKPRVVLYAFWVSLIKVGIGLWRSKFKGLGC